MKYKKVIMIGNFEVDYSTESEWAWTYESLGIKVIRAQENKTRTEYILKQAIKGVDFVHYVHTHGWVTPGKFPIEVLLKKLKKLNILTIGVHLDYWRGLEREKDVGNHPFWNTDFVFTADGGSHEWYRKKGINHIYLPAGVVERDCHFGILQERFKHDVIFVGSRGYHPEWPYRPQLIDWLQETYGDRFGHYGGDGRGVIRGKSLNDLYASSKVVIGDTLCLDFKHPDYFSDRLFETTGRGGFLIFPYVRGIEEMFKLGKELIIYRFGNFDDNIMGLKGCIDYYIEHEDERKAIQKAGFERTKKDHTYTNRARTIIEKLENEKK